MTQPLAEIFSQGDEVVTGEIADTNAAWLASELTGLGFAVGRHSAVGDRLEALVGLLREIAGRAELCLCSGGLGPTCDDLTAEAVSRAFGRPLEMDGSALIQIEAWFRRLDRPMPAVNRKQALLPRGASRLDNLWGTAPGFAIVAGRCRFFFLPGVPREMQAMFRQSVGPALPAFFPLKPRPRVILHTVGLGESTLQERLDPVSLPPGVELGFRAGGAENQVKLAFPQGSDAATVDATVASVVAAIGHSVYAIGRNGDTAVSLSDAIGERLTEREARLFVVETVSGGALAASCSGTGWLAGAWVEPAPKRLLSRLSAKVGGSPADTATTLAEAVRQREDVDYVLLQYGHFTPSETCDATARIEVWFALAGPAGALAESRGLTGDPQRKRDAARAHALDLLRRHLAGLTPP